MTTMNSSTLDAIMEVRGDRVDTYGKPEDNFREIAAYWSTYLSQNLKNILTQSEATAFPEIALRPADVAKLMALLKVARDNKAAKQDNMVDGANYLIIAGDIEYCNGNQTVVNMTAPSSVDK